MSSSADWTAQPVPGGSSQGKSPPHRPAPELLMRLDPAAGGMGSPLSTQPGWQPSSSSASARGETNLEFTGQSHQEPEFDDCAGGFVDVSVVPPGVPAQAGERLVHGDALASGDHALRLFNDDA